mmetsp:Transcript_23380/g.37476  ORF Transcript_23380/g.37476 Transcript_23380/m.37476 type:complete len:121 (-) Transcript_23380:386-748(-)
MDPQIALKLTAAATASYGAQMGLAPTFGNKLHWKKGHPEHHNFSRWFGHALGGMAIAQALASTESSPNKAVLVASGVQYLSAPLVMLSQKKDMKPEMIVANSVLCGGIGLLCLKCALDAK